MKQGKSSFYFLFFTYFHHLGHWQIVQVYVLMQLDSCNFGWKVTKLKRYNHNCFVFYIQMENSYTNWAINTFTCKLKHRSSWLSTNELKKETFAYKNKYYFNDQLANQHNENILIFSSQTCQIFLNDTSLI